LIARRTGLAGFTLSQENLERAVKRAWSQGWPADPQALPPSHWDSLIDELTVRETMFFRHLEQFEILRSKLPELRAQLPQWGALRVWSAGCASGEEPYSLAMLFADEGMLEHTQITATDISRAAIERGRSGSYREWSFRSIDPALYERHVARHGGVSTVSERLRRHVTFGQLNLAEKAPPGTPRYGLIFCRNVLMFMDAGTVELVARRLFDALSPGGYLFTGPSDPNLGAYVDLEVHVTPAGLLYRRPNAARIVLDSTPPPMAAEEPAPPAPLAMPESEPRADVAALVTAVRESWNARGPEAALLVCRDALACAGNELELNHLQALLLWELERHSQAASAMRRVLFLDHGCALAHFGLGILLERLGDARGARRSFTNALCCCDKLGPDAAVPLGDGIRAGGLRRAAERSLRRIGPAADGGGEGAAP
jgi:chemotaxis protein methyltransferase CheR